jgi:hypothetical protein
MSGHNRRLGLQPYRAPHPTIWAAYAALITLAVTACASSAATTPTGPAPTPATFGTVSHAGTLTGAGSTFVAPFFAVAFAKYHQQNPGVSISYAAVGSGAGITAFSAKQADFGASDVPMTASEQAAARGGRVTQVPDALGGEGVAYNLSLPAGARLHLTGPVLARIFLGQIARAVRCWERADRHSGLRLPSSWPFDCMRPPAGRGRTHSRWHGPGACRALHVAGASAACQPDLVASASSI